MTAATPVVLPASDEDRLRWEISKLRHRMLEGAYLRDLQTHMAKHLDPARLDAWGPPTMALNAFKAFIDQLAVLYDAEPAVSNPDLTPEAASYLNSLNLFCRHKQHQRYVLGLRESLLRIHWLPGNQAASPGIAVRIVTPDAVVVTALASAPTAPIRIEEAVWRVDPMTKAGGWTWDLWSIEDPANPYFRIEQDDGQGQRKDVTAKYVADPTYAYIDPDSGHPYLPWVLCHAEDSGRLWSPTEWHELVSGSMDIGLLASFWIHVVKDASWSQKVGIDVDLAGLSPAGAGATSRQRVSTDPASLLMFRSLGDRSGSLNSLQTSADPKAIIEAIVIFARMIGESMGLSAADVERSQAESGVAIQLRRDAIRRMQARFAPQFRKGDLEMLRKVAMISNTFAPAGTPLLPTSGWSITYPGLPYSREEMAERFAALRERVEFGVASKVDVILAEHPNWTREQAVAELTRIQAENRQFA